MREEHPLQQELTGLPTPGSDQVREMSEVAKLQSDVLPLGLVREARPVFVYDAKLAKEKTGNAVRQARFREKKAAQGLVTVQIPAEVADRLKTLNGDWSLMLGALSPPSSVEVLEIIKEVLVEVIKEVRVEVPGPVQYVEKLIQGPTEYIEKIIEIKVPGPVNYVDKIVEKQILKMTSEQKKCLLLGQKVHALLGFKRYLVRKIVGF